MKQRLRELRTYTITADGLYLHLCNTWKNSSHQYFNTFVEFVMKRRQVRKKLTVVGQTALFPMQKH